MNNSGTRRIQGRGWAPGVVRGTATLSPNRVTHQHVLIIDQSQADQIPSDVAALILMNAIPFAHATVHLFRLGIPIVSIETEQAAQIDEGQIIVVNGGDGSITLDNAAIKIETLPTTQPNEAVVTRDGVHVNLTATAGNVEAVKAAKRNGAYGIGLLRAEAIAASLKQVPDVSFYVAEFRKLFEAASPLPIRVRLLDLAADKMPAWVDSPEMVCRDHGMQGSRLFNIPQLRTAFYHQLMAIDAIADQYEIGVTIPFISNIAELRYWRSEIRSRMSKRVTIGAMVENPIAAMSIPEFLNEVDYVAIGCNDLMQYLFAAERTSASLAKYLDPYHPALFRFMRLIAQQAREEIDRIQLSGLLSQLPGILPVMLAMGFRTVSAQPTFLPYLRQTAAITDVGAFGEIVDRICSAHTSEEVFELLQSSRSLPP